MWGPAGLVEVWLAVGSRESGDYDMADVACQLQWSAY